SDIRLAFSESSAPRLLGGRRSQGRVQLDLGSVLRRLFHVDLLLNDDRQCERKRRALAGLRLNPDFAPVHLNDALRYGKPQAGAALLAGDRIVGLLKLLEQLGLIGSGDARASVADRYME